MHKVHYRIICICSYCSTVSSSTYSVVEEWLQYIVNFLDSYIIINKIYFAGANSHTAEYMCEEIAKVVEELGPQKIMALCTDNASNMKKAWRLLEERYPNLECYGCLAHGLNLIFSDGLKLESISSMISECTSLIKTIKHSYILLAMFKAKQTEKKISTVLKLPIKTR